MDQAEQLEAYLDSVCRSPAIRLPLRRHLLQLADKLIADAKDKAAKRRRNLLQLADKLIADACDKAGEARRHGLEFFVPTLAEAIREVLKVNGNQFDPPKIPTRDEAIAKTLRDFGKAIKSQYTLKQLVKLSSHFLYTVCWTGRLLLDSEAKPWRFILIEWEAPSIKAETLRSCEEDKDYYTELIAQLREVFQPDPVKQVRLQRTRSEHVAVKHTGNYATVSEPFSGVSIRRLDTKEYVERAQLIGKLSSNIATVVHELAMVSNKDRDAARQIARLSRKLVKLARSFGQRREREPVISPVPSLEESLEQMKTLNGLMEAVAG